MDHFPLTEPALCYAFFLQLEAIFSCIIELLSPVESGLVFLKGQWKDC